MLIKNYYLCQWEGKTCSFAKQQSTEFQFVATMLFWLNIKRNTSKQKNKVLNVGLLDSFVQARLNFSHR